MNRQLFTCRDCGETSTDHAFYPSCPMCGFGRAQREQQEQAVMELNSCRVTFSGEYGGMLEELTTRQYDEHGVLRNEMIERRAWLAPAARVPATQLRSFSSQSFVPYQPPAQLGAGSPVTSDGLTRLLEEFDLLDKER